MKLLQLIKQLFRASVPPKRYPAVNPKQIIYIKKENNEAV